MAYVNEREGQIAFFDNYGIPYNDDASVLVDNTDGVYNGNILEFNFLCSGALTFVPSQSLRACSRFMD